VVIGRRLATDSVDVVRSADAKGTAMVVGHLTGLGHSRIVHVSGGPGVISADRRNGYLRAMRRHSPGELATIIDGEFTEIAGLAAANQLLGGELPTAVVCANDRIAIGVIDGLRRRGVDIPGEVSIVGYDDSVLARLGHIDLTSVSQQPQEQADRTAVLGARSTPGRSRDNGRTQGELRNGGHREVHQFSGRSRPFHDRLVVETVVKFPISRTLG
jgi:DNA-binding LacI/PurR family transcriptional regulator